MDPLTPAEHREKELGPGKLWLAFFRGGSFDGHTEIWFGQLRRKIIRTWFDNSGLRYKVGYILREPVQGGFVEYVLADPQPTFPPKHGD